MTHASHPAEARAALGIDDGLVRISVGLEAADDLWADIERALTMGVVGSSGDPELIPNLQGGAEVTCTVEAASGGFRVSAELADAPNLRITIPVLSTENTADNPADGSATYASTDTGGDVYASPPETPCKFWLDLEDWMTRASHVVDAAVLVGALDEARCTGPRAPSSAAPRPAPRR
jgi:hypothetical protein